LLHAPLQLWDRHFVLCISVCDLLLLLLLLLLRLLTRQSTSLPGSASWHSLSALALHALYS
jgi:hypothetical protein